MIYINSKIDFENYYNNKLNAYFFEDDVYFDNFITTKQIILDKYKSINCNSVKAYKIKCYDLQCDVANANIIRCNDINSKIINCNYINANGNIYSNKIKSDLVLFDKICFATEQLDIKNFRAFQKDFELKCIGVHAVA